MWKLQKKEVWYGCLCEYCTNAEFKIKTLHIRSLQQLNDLKLRDLYEALNMTLCSKGDQKFVLHSKEI